MKRRRALGFALGALGILAGAFCANGIASRWAQPVVGQVDRPAASGVPARLNVVAFNLAKAGFHRSGLQFRAEADVRRTLDDVAALLRAEQVDVAFLSEVVWEAGPCQVNQVRHLAGAAGLRHFAFGENYSFGLPWYRIRSGNAVLSRWPIVDARAQALPGPTGWLDPTNVRRALWVEIELGTRRVRAVSVRNDSVDPENNRAQVEALLREAGGGEVLLAGDFNAAPGSPAIDRIASTGRFLPLPVELTTFPAWQPSRAIDHIFAPSSWTARRWSTPASSASDHLPIVATFELPTVAGQ